MFKHQAEQHATELAVARSRITELENIIEVWSTQARNLEADRASIGARLAEAQASIAEKAREVVESKEALLVAQSRVLELERGVEVWSTQARNLEADRASIGARLAETQASLAKKAREAVESKGALQVANEEIARLYRSRSWRWTRPLRALRRAPSKLRLALRRWGSNYARSLYRTMPIPLAAKKWIKSTLFNIAPFFFRHAHSYHSWLELQRASLPPVVGSPNADSHTRSQSEKISAGHVGAFGPDSIVPLPINEDPLQVAPSAQLIAFYLPQFHPIPENDRFWGKGFTEWTNVTRATPQFVGHYQPRLPGELGFYDLRLIDVQRRQVELAKLYGIGGFCFYFYWFNGQRLLETPLEQYLANAELDLPFCLCWANENWTRAWDGRSKEVLIAQHHSPEDDLAFIQHLARYLADPRYIRVKGKPLVIVYRPGLLTAPHETAGRWRSWCRDQGLGEIFLAYVQSFESVDPAKYGFDAAIEFPPNNMHCPPYPGEVELLNPSFSGLVFDWEFFVRRSESFQQPSYTLFRGVCPSWDNEARRPGRGTVMFGSTPEGYRQWLKNVLQDTVSRFDDQSERLIFINAWNEWAEGAYLEPDLRYGYAYLQATRDAIDDGAIRPDPTETTKSTNATARSRSGILVVSHDAHPHGAQFLALNIMRELRQVMALDAECLLLRDGPLTSAYSELGPVHELHGCNPQTPEAQEIVGRLKARGFHTALCNTTASGHFVPLLKNAGFKVVSLVHELPHVLETYEGSGLKYHARSISAAADYIVFPGDFVADGFRQVAPFDAAKAVNLTQGLYKRNRLRTAADIAHARAQLRERFGLAADTQIVLCVGFADRRKGVDIFIDVGELVLANLPKTAFLWVGQIDGAIEQEVTNRIARSQHSEQFIFPGFISDTDLLYAGADLYALTSREDPFPSVILEALEVGVPLVAFEGVGAFEQMIRSNGVGRLVPPFDMAAFAREVISLLEDDGKRIAMGRTGSDLINREFSFRKYVYDLLAIAKVPVKRTSVIVPNYNYRQYLEARLSSINKQTIPPYEVIVIDDASTDGSYEWLEENLERLCPSAELIRNGSNSGSVLNQWLTGVRRARGDYVWIAEADDLSEPQFLAETLSKFDDPDVVLSFCQSKQMDSEGEILCDNYLDYVKDVSPTKWTGPYVNNGVDEIVTALSVKNTIPNVSAVVFKRETLLAVLESKLTELKQFRVAGDWLTYIEVLRSGSIAFSPNSLNLHRRHTSGVTLSSLNLSQLREIMLVQESVREEFSPPDVFVSKAASYSVRLFEKFGLASSETPSIHKHPELRRFFSGTDSER